MGNEGHTQEGENHGDRKAHSASWKGGEPEAGSSSSEKPVLVGQKKKWGGRKQGTRGGWGKKLGVNQIRTGGPTASLGDAISKDHE